MSRTLLILAASAYQLDAIRTAKRLGYRVVTTDNQPTNPGHALADRAHGADTTDIPAVLKIARAERIDGIISPCTDVAVLTAATVARELGFPGVSPDAARVVVDKVAFRRFIEEQKMPVPCFVEIGPEITRLPDMFRRGEWRVVKPDRSSGSKGIFIVRSDAELASRLPESRAFSPTGTVVVEEFLDGHQGTCEGVLEGGRIRFHAILDRQTAPPPFVTTTGHHLPTTLGPEPCGRLLSRLDEVWRRLGVTDGPFDCDFVWARDEIYLLEITPRLGGNSISQLLRLATGFDLVEYAVRHACGDKVAPPSAPEIQPAAVVLLGVWNEGRLRFDAGEEARLRTEPWVKSLAFDVAPGTAVHPFINGRHRVGEAYVVAPDRAILEQRVRELKMRLAVRAE